MQQKNESSVSDVFWLSLLLLLIAGCQDPKTADPAVLRVDATTVVRKAASLLTGANIQWTDQADGIYDAKTLSWNQPLVKQVQSLGPASLRFPGGDLSDVYHWKDGVGPLAQRRNGVRSSRKETAVSSFGTDEFLDLAARLRAVPMITANALTGTAEEAAGWVRYVNLEKKAGVRYWEIGNEPYLIHPSLGGALDTDWPERYARRFVEFSKQMKAADPSLLIGLPLRSNDLGRYPGTPFSNWNERVVKIAGAHADFISLHNAYFPAIFRREEVSFSKGFRAMMTAPETVLRDIRKTRRQLTKLLPEKKLPIAVTEYNAFFAVPEFPEVKATTSLGAGLYVATLLAEFFKEEDLFMAHVWSLCGNGVFGMISNDLKLRPQFFVFRLFAEYIKNGDIVSSSWADLPLFNSQAVGMVPAMENVGVASALCAVSENSLAMIFVNKTPDLDIPVSVKVRGFSVSGQAEAVILTGPDMRSDNESDETIFPRSIRLDSWPQLTLPRRSVLAVRLKGQRVLS